MKSLHGHAFDWDVGNETKCERHGVSLDAIEAMFCSDVRVAPDLAHSDVEQRFIAVGRIPSGFPGGGRAVFVAFTIRERYGIRLIRPVSARFMHAKEQQRYEESESPDPPHR